jgi:hypothetical protein
VAILADDLIWGTRLAELARGAGAEPVAVRTRAALETALPGVDGVVIDLTARAYDGMEAVTVARSARKRVLAVGQHDDAALRQLARAAGAVFVPYRRLSDDGAHLISTWLSDSGSDSGLAETPA